MTAGRGEDGVEPVPGLDPARLFFEGAPEGVLQLLELVVGAVHDVSSIVARSVVRPRCA